MQIPYMVEPHPETGINNAKLGIWLFIASEVMLFGALFATYIVLRVGGTDWPVGSSILNVPLATVNTIVLIASSVTMVMAWASLKRNDFSKYRMYMALTVGAGAIFLCIKYVEYTSKFEHGLYPSTNTFMAIYFTLTGLHGLHVISGMVVNSFLLGPGAKMWHTEPERLTSRVEASGLFWHLVDLVWIFLFPVLYLT